MSWRPNRTGQKRRGRKQNDGDGYPFSGTTSDAKQRFCRGKAMKQPSKAQIWALGTSGSRDACGHRNRKSGFKSGSAFSPLTPLPTEGMRSGYCALSCIRPSVLSFPSHPGPHPWSLPAFLKCGLMPTRCPGCTNPLDCRLLRSKITPASPIQPGDILGCARVCGHLYTKSSSSEALRWGASAQGLSGGKKGAGDTRLDMYRVHQPATATSN